MTPHTAKKSDVRSAHTWTCHARRSESATSCATSMLTGGMAVSALSVCGATEDSVAGATPGTAGVRGCGVDALGGEGSVLPTGSRDALNARSHLRQRNRERPI